MAPKQMERIKELFDSALDISPAERRPYLDRLCADDAIVRSEVDRLLRESESGDLPAPRPSERAVSLAAGALIANRYKITRLLGRGGMGEVYEAHDQLMDEDVALKTLRAHLSRKDAYVRRFQKEMQLARKVTHPNVCRVLDVGVDPDTSTGRPPLRFFTMELLRGETLYARIRRVERLTRAEAFPIAVQVAEGLQAAHDMGIVHTDFKSGNVILVPADGGERAVITDFGLARHDPSVAAPDQTHSMTTLGPLAGTVAYMSPEQMTGGIVTKASDIYSFGIVLFEMATGKLPFDDEHMIHAAVQRVSGEGVTVRSLAPDIDRRWEWAIAKCLERDPERRFPSAGDMAEWFRADAWRMPRLWTRRDWVRAALAAGAPVVAGSGYWIWSHQPYRPQAAAIVWYEKGVDALHSMTYEAARKTLEQAVVADPKFALAHASLARAYDELDYSERAKESMLRALTVAQETRLSNADATRVKALQFLVSREYERATPLFQQIEDSADQRDKPAAALEVGWLAERREQTEVAAAAYVRALKMDPRYAAAKLRLGYIQGRRRQLDAALKTFKEAEDLYSASSDYEGVTETLLQRALLLNRSTRSAEAMPVIENALAVARTVGNAYQQIRLQLTQATAVRNLGDTNRASVVAQQAIDAAITQKMDNLATSGLIELGNSMLARGDLAGAEPIFRKALDVAGRGKVRRNEARARASLASLCERDHRPDEAQKFIEVALPFFRQAGYRRDFVQGMTLLGGIHEQRAEFEEGARVMREALTAATQLQDARTEALIRERLGDNLRDQGAWPVALSEFERAASLLQSSGADPRLSCADLYWRLGRREDAEQSIAEAERLLKGSPNRQLMFNLRISQARFAYQERRMRDAIYFSREALLTAPSFSEAAEPSARLIEVLVLIRSRATSTVDDSGRDIIGNFERAKLVFDAACARLAIAEAWMATTNPSPAVKSSAYTLALEALSFFEARRIWESVWRAHSIAALASQGRTETEKHRTAASSALNQLKGLWPRDSFDSYLRRPDIRSLAKNMKI
jgi:eukaryotic-like serine/threonine-protein kinase